MLADYDDTVGQCRDCGNPRSECSDHERVWYPQRMVCYATMEISAAQHLYDELHKDRPFHDGTWLNWSPERSAATPYHYSDGVTIYASPEDDNPGDFFTTDANARPWDEPDGEAQ